MPPAVDGDVDVGGEDVRSGAASVDAAIVADSGLCGGEGEELEVRLQLFCLCLPAKGRVYINSCLNGITIYICLINSIYTVATNIIIFVITMLPSKHLRWHHFK